MLSIFKTTVVSTRQRGGGGGCIHSSVYLSVCASYLSVKDELSADFSVGTVGCVGFKWL